MQFIEFTETCLGIVGAVSAMVLGHFPSARQPLTVVKSAWQPGWLFPHGSEVPVAFGVATATTPPTGTVAAVRAIVEITGNQSIRDCWDSAISEVCLSCWSAAALTL